MAHYYDLQGNPHHTVPTKKGAKNATRPTQIKDARENGWLPSVSAKCDMLGKPWLVRWKCIEAVKLALCRPLIESEDLQEASSQLVDRFLNEAGEAAEIGTRIHAEIENFFVCGACLSWVQGYGDSMIAMEPIIDRIEDVLDDNALYPVKSEFVTVNPSLGYAGTVDMLVNCGPVSGLADFKSTKTTPGKPVTYGDTHPVQLAAYLASEFHKGSLTPDFSQNFALNIYISTTEPGRVEAKFWTTEELQAAWKAFLAMSELYRWQNNWDPRVPNSRDEGRPQAVPSGP